MFKYLFVLFISIIIVILSLIVVTKGLSMDETLNDQELHEIYLLNVLSSRVTMMEKNIMEINKKINKNDPNSTNEEEEKKEEEGNEPINQEELDE